jgi:hypothetical protein
MSVVTVRGVRARTSPSCTRINGDAVGNRVLPFLLLAGTLMSVPAQAARPASIPVDVLVTSPADTVTELQVICLFRSDPSNTLHGSLIEMNQKLQGLLARIRLSPGPDGAQFLGELGETLLIAPRAGTLSARRLLVIGLGDSRTFTPARMNLVGEIVFGEANRLRVKRPFFAPTVLDGGVSGFGTGEVAEQFMRGFLRARDLELELKSRGVSAGESVESLSFLAGAAHAADTKAGISKAVDAAKARQ